MKKTHKVLALLPAAFRHDGWYPTRYEISWSKYRNAYTIALRDLQFHQGQ